jgi:hypothetical protein
MVDRCTREKNWQYPLYGPVGVCERWLKFDAFLADMGERPAGKFIERRDNSKGYAADNCCWASRTEQNRNRRNTRLSPEIAAEIRRRRSAGEIFRTIAADFEISISMAHAVASDKIWLSRD